MMDQQQIESLVQEARDVCQHAYVPYSHFPVGAALLMKDGAVITGVNVENVSFGATNCAERTALFTSIARGYGKGQVAAIAVAGDTQGFLTPCSLCRQVMVELCDKETPVYLTRNDGAIHRTSIEELVPLSFDSMDI